MRRNIIYPGHSISVKRIFHMLTLCLIPITVFIQKVEGVLIEHMFSTSKVVADAAPSANTISKSLTPVIPVLEALENSNGRELIEKLSIPTSRELKEKRRAFRQVATYQDQSSSLITTIITMLKWMGILAYLPIAYACLWFYFDLKIGNQKFTSLLCIGLATFTCFHIWRWLIANYQNLLGQ